MLPLLSALTKPSIVRDVEQEIDVLLRLIAHDLAEHVFETDERGKSQILPREFERDPPVSRREAATNGGKPAEKGQPTY